MKFAILLMAALFVSSCKQSEKSVFSGEKAKLRIRLIDAPSDQVKKIFIHVEHIEMLVEKDGEMKGFIFGKKLGLVDMLRLREGVFLPVGSLSLEEGTSVKEIRMVLKNGNHHLIRKDGSHCDLVSVPGIHGLEHKIQEERYLQAGQEYLLTLDFDALESVVLNKNGECFLRPVLRVGPLVENIPAPTGEWDEDEETAEEESIEVVSEHAE